MTIEFISGSIWRVVGSDNPDSLVGAPPAGIVFSEWALGNPSAWGYLAPILDENGGWAIFITTPRGRNHVKSMLDLARANPWSRANPSGWYAEVLTPAQTGYPVDRIEKQRVEYHAIFGQDAGDALIEQEYWCSFDAAVLGAYWARELIDAQQAGRVGVEVYDDSLPVHTAWDLGVGDSTAIWCFQIHLDELRIVDFYEASGYAADHYVQWLAARPYTYGDDWLPHDARAREWTNSGDGGLAKTRIETLKGMGRRPRIVPMHRLDDGINAGRQAIRRAWFNPGVVEALEGLKQYRREWDDSKKVFSDRPFHDWTSHRADAWRYLAMAWREVAVVTKPAPPPARGIREATLDEMWAKRRSNERV